LEAALWEFERIEASVSPLALQRYARRFSAEGFYRKMAQALGLSDIEEANVKSAVN
jgi:hypothetical protein